MSKKKIAFSEATPELLQKVQEVLSMRSAHKLSMSLIYEVHNKLFGLNEKPESCASCLKRRADAISVWYAGYLAEQPTPPVIEEPVEPAQAEADTAKSQGTTEKTAAKLGEYQRPENAVDYPVGEDGGVIVFTPGAEDESKGTVTMADGTYVKPGSYESGENTIKVQVGGKATVTNNLL